MGSRSKHFVEVTESKKLDLPSQASKILNSSSERTAFWVVSSLPHNDETDTSHLPQHAAVSATATASINTNSDTAPKSTDRAPTMEPKLQSGIHPPSAPSSYLSHDLPRPHSYCHSNTSGTTTTFRGGRGPRRRIKGGKRKQSYGDVLPLNYRKSGGRSFGTSARAFFGTPMDGEGLSLFLAVALWYSMGVISISTSKILLTPQGGRTLTTLDKRKYADEYYQHVGGVPPLVLTFQQLVLGSTLLWILLTIKCLGTNGLQSWDSLLVGGTREKRVINGGLLEESFSFQIIIPKVMKSTHGKYLIWAGMCFTMGFYATNLGFGGASASFVETIKAAEPITSAFLAVTYGLDVLNGLEIASLGSIVLGVLLSTVGNASTSLAPSLTSSSSSSLFYESLISCATVMAANLCFSFRGLYQKLFRSKYQKVVDSESSTSNHIAKDANSLLALDDLNLQFKMQQLGVWILFLPATFIHGFAIVNHVIRAYSTVGLFHTGIFMRYMGLALVNGFAFTTYNLASTYLLSRISVVQHAALNCIRRIFAVIVTCFVFNVSLTITGIIGICISFGGFMVFSFAKAKKKSRPQPPPASNTILPLLSVGSNEHLHGS